MKRAVLFCVVLAAVLCVVLAAGISATVWHAASLSVRVTDARPEAVATGGILLTLASILRRNVAGRIK